MVDPVTQWFGSGLGQKGSTSNIGACLPEADDVRRGRRVRCSSVPAHRLAGGG